MPLYRIVWDGLDILDYTDPNMVLLVPDLEQEVNMAGSLEFVVPPYHTYYEMFKAETMITPTVEVYEDNEMIWFGRPIELQMDFFKQKKVYCEGALSFFNDSIQYPVEHNSISIRGFFSLVVSFHNANVSQDRQFMIGNVTVDDKTVYRKTEYENSLDTLKSMCLDTNGGYLFFRRENGTNYIDWLKDMPFICNQPVEFALNMLNLKDGFNGAEFCTCVLPLGKENENGDPLTIATVNNGDNVIKSDAVETYGKITKVLTLPDIKTATELYSEGIKYLEDSQFNTSLIECSAADLHCREKDVNFFKLGQTIHVKSVPHFVDKDLPLSKISIRFDTAAKQITLGIIKKKTLSRIYKEDSGDTGGGSWTPPDYDPTVIEDPQGIEWEIVMPKEEGEPVTAYKMPTNIKIVREPYKTQYECGEAIDFTGLLVRIELNGQRWVGAADLSGKYITSEAPFNELTFSTETAPATSYKNGFPVVVTWTYKGRSYSDTFKIYTEVADKPDLGPITKIAKDTHAYIYASNGHRKNYGFEVEGSGMMTKILLSEHNVYHIHASTVQGTRWFGKSIAGGHDNESAALTQEFTYAGKTVYYAAYSGSWYGRILEIYPVCNNGAITTGVNEEVAKAVAWHLVYG